MKIKTTLVCFATSMITLGGLTQVHASNLPVTLAEQKTMTPDSVLADLLAGNERYVAGKLSDGNVKARVKAAKAGQHPKAFILSCVDSRVPVESVFDQGIGDIFVGRVAGNVENEDQLGSMEYATKYVDVKVVMVLWHESCGAVKGACAGIEDGNLTLLLEKIAPAVEQVEGFKKSDRTADNKQFVASVVETNVRKTVEDIRARSPIMAGLEAEGKIKIVGGLYSLHTGKVTLLD